MSNYFDHLLNIYQEMKLLHQQQQSSQQTPASAAAPESDHVELEEPGQLHDE